MITTTTASQFEPTSSKPERPNFYSYSMQCLRLCTSAYLRSSSLSATRFFLPSLSSVKSSTCGKCSRFLYTVWETEHTFAQDTTHQPLVDVFITVAGEPVELVEKTLAAARAMDYPDFEVYLLNDGFVANKDNWRDIEALASRYGVHCITRTVPGGAKAGNINNALNLSHNPLVAIFDADHVPHGSFLAKDRRLLCRLKGGLCTNAAVLQKLQRKLPHQKLVGAARALFWPDLQRQKPPQRRDHVRHQHAHFAQGAFWKWAA